MKKIEKQAATARGLGKLERAGMKGLDISLQKVNGSNTKCSYIEKKC